MGEVTGLDHKVLVNILLLDAEALGPFIECDVLVIIEVALCEEAGSAVFHGDEWSAERGQFSVGQISIDGVLVQLTELPVHGEDVHVVVLFKVTDQQLY